MWISRELYEGFLRQSEQAAMLRIAVSELEKERMFLREQVVQERQRTDTALDELLALRGLPPVSPPKTPDREQMDQLFEEDDKELAQLKDRIKRDGIGAVMQDEMERNGG
jgi:hypothetical protein